MTTYTTQNTTVLARQEVGRTFPRWKHLVAVTDHGVWVVDMVPAILGWNIRSVVFQDPQEAWCGWSRESIVDSKKRDADDCDREPTAEEIEFVLTSLNSGRLKIFTKESK